jgi:glycosyltransferase involved in cell wall biosynthesis
VNILFISSSSDWHIDLWVKYYTKNHQVFLFSDKEDYLKRQSFENVEIIEYEGYLGKLLNFFNIKSHFLFQINKLVSVRYFASKVDLAITNSNIEIIHAHSLYYGFLLSFIKSDIPVVFTPMGSDIIIHAQKNILYKYMAKKIFNRANIVTGDSILLQQSGYKVGAKSHRNYIIQNGVDSSIFFPKNNNLKAKYNISDDETILFSPRSITPLYNIDIIIEAMYGLKSAGYKVKCMFSFAFGDKYSIQLKNQVKKLGLDNNVIWLGFLNYKQMAEHYNLADIVISVPSSDSSPKSVYEAMFCKKPIIVSDLEWSYELLSNSDCVRRVNVRDSINLEKTIKDLISNPDLRSEISSNALEYASKYFDYKKNMIEMEKIMFESIN